MPFDVHQELVDCADALTDPYQHREPRWTWSESRNRISLPDHVVTLPGLVTQVGQIVWPSSRQDDGDFHVRSVPSSRPPGDPEASACYVDITIAVTRWHVMLRLTLRDTVESSIRQLLAQIMKEDRDTQILLLKEMRSWRHRCEVVLKIATPDPQLQVPCPVEGCGQRTIRVSQTKVTARCTTCRQRWAEHEDPAKGVGSIGVLAEWIRQWQESSRAAADGAWAVARERKSAGRSAA